MRSNELRSGIACLVLCLLTLAPAPAFPAEVFGCGSGVDRWQEERFLHRQAARRRGATRPGKPGARAAATGVRQAGDIILMDDSDGVTARRHAFNLSNRSLLFVPLTAEARRYRYQVGGPAFDVGAAAEGSKLAGMADDDTRELTLPFAFSFFGEMYRSVFVNADGNLTFRRPDTETSARSLSRVAAGPPRIAPLFRDLDPGRSYTGIRVRVAGDRITVTWLDVPELLWSGAGHFETFQVRLFADGRIEFAYTTIRTDSALVGLSPGNTPGASTVASFRDDPAQEISSTFIERFSSATEIDIWTVAQKFYAAYGDAYDYLVVYNALGFEAAQGAVAYALTVRSQVEGIGKPLWDTGAEFSSPERLKAVLNMGRLDQYPEDPNAHVTRRGSSPDTPLSVLAHEVGHLFLSFASVRTADDPRPMLDYTSAHWNFAFNSEASLLEGNRIQDKGLEVVRRFETTGAVEGYSALDQYLMGFRGAEEVPPTFYVVPADGYLIRQLHTIPLVGFQFPGTRYDVTVQDIIGAVGERRPDHHSAQRHFRLAFVLVVAAGQDAPPEAIEKVDRLRREFPAYFDKATSGRASAETTP